MTIRVRRMTREDIGRAVEIESASFSEPWTEEIFSATLLLPYAYYYVAEVDEGRNTAESLTGECGDQTSRIVAQCGIRDILGEGEITNVAVHPEFRGMGISNRLLSAAIADAMEQGVQVFTLEVRAGNAAAIALYEHFGFQTEGIRRNFYEKPVEDALIMWRRCDHAQTGLDD